MLMADGSLKTLTEADKAGILLKVDELSSQALRVLAIAVKPLRSPELPYDEDGEVEDKFAAIVEDLTLLGLVASIDPERDGVKQAVTDAKFASIRTARATRAPSRSLGEKKKTGGKTLGLILGASQTAKRVCWLTPRQSLWKRVLFFFLSNSETAYTPSRETNHMKRTI